jgi:RNA-directed DNA polymerase
VSVFIYSKVFTLGLWVKIKSLLDVLTKGRGHGIQELARRLDMTPQELQAVQPSYREFFIPKRSGGRRRILAPDEPLKKLQRRILRRLFGRLKCHAAAMGFEKARSIVTNAQLHVGHAVVLKMDIKDFFPSTRSKRVYYYFRKIGWNREVANLLVRLCTHEGGLPQGAPTSPRLSNLVNHRLDARLTGLAAGRWFRNPMTGEMAGGEQYDAVYSRYADDLTFSFPADDPDIIHYVIRMTNEILTQEGYNLHFHKKLVIARRHARQQVTGLVVNERVNLPRHVRRWLRAVEHRAATGKQTSLTPAELAGWRALRAMVSDQC